MLVFFFSANGNNDPTFEDGKKRKFEEISSNEKRKLKYFLRNSKKQTFDKILC